MVKNIVILGSTGSIGQNALKIIEKFPDKFKVIGLSANENIDLLQKQILDFNVPCAAVYNEKKAVELKKSCPDSKSSAGEEGIKELCRLTDCSMVLNAIIGSSGLCYTVEAIRQKKNIALANKESYVMAGEILNQLIKENNIQIIPVDSEHSAIFHLINNLNKNDIEKYYLTSSGGPFLYKPSDEFDNITIEDTMNHPTWDMGGKITVDSATMMNKGFEVIEAHYLFNADYDDIEIVIHPQSIIHSMVKTRDGEVYAQMSPPDMKFPILNALSYPDKLENPYKGLNLFDLKDLTFQKPDSSKFPLIEYAYEAGRRGGNIPAALSIADDIAVSQFLNGKIKYKDIYTTIKKIVGNIKYIEKPDLDDILRMEKEMTQL